MEWKCDVLVCLYLLVCLSVMCVCMCVVELVVSVSISTFFSTVSLFLIFACLTTTRLCKVTWFENGLRAHKKFESESIECAKRPKSFKWRSIAEMTVDTDDMIRIRNGDD